MRALRPNRILAACRVLITGSSSGIGRALALELARRHAKLVLTARRATRLKEVVRAVRQAGSEAVDVPGDLTDRTLPRALMDAAQQHYGGLDVLVNNAGIGGIGTFASADAERLRQIMEVNFFAPAELIRQALPLLRASSDAAIVNVGSVLGHCAVPKKSEYCASKFALHGFTDALRAELAAEGIDVVLVSPSTTDSEFFSQALRSDGDAAENRRRMSPEVVARHVVRAIECRRREVILSASGRMLVWADRLIPGWTSYMLQRFG